VKATPPEARLSSDLRIVDYADRHAAVFRDLNLDWIEEHFAIEEIDRRHLLAPSESILAPGGAIFIAERNGIPVGCCAVLNHGGGVYEVSKMAVDRQCRGVGIGRALLSEVIRRARIMGAVRLTIISNTVLASAIHLYRDIGFREVLLESDAYARGNIALELALA